MTKRFKARIIHDFEGPFVSEVGHILLGLTQTFKRGI